MATIDKKGILHGKVDKCVYRYYRGMQIVQIKPSKIKQTIASKEAGLEFGLAASTAAGIRSAFSHVYKGNDGAMANRLTSLTLKSIKTAVDKPRGERDIHDGDPDMFSGFQFNISSTLDDCLRVKPKPVWTEDGKLSVHIPAFTAKDLRAPQASYYVIRFMAVSFNFKTSYASYLCCKDIKIKQGKGFEGGDIELIDALPPGRLVLLSMFIQAYQFDHYEGYSSINNKAWSPGGIIGGWHAPAQEEPKATNDLEQEKAIVGEVTIYSVPYQGDEIQEKFRKLRAKQDKKMKASVKPKPDLPDITGDLPIGDFSIKR